MGVDVNFISLRHQIIKEAVTKPAFIESLKVKYGEDPNFVTKTQNKDGEEVISINKDAVILINKFYGYNKELSSINQASTDYSDLIENLPSTWGDAANLMGKYIGDMSADPTKAGLISLGLKEEDLVNGEVRAWLEDRYIKNKGSEVQPISEAIGTVKEYIASKDAILNKIKTDEGLRKELEDRDFNEDRLRKPLSLSVDHMVSILNQYKHGGKTTIKTVGVEIRAGENIGKVGGWNLWLPQTQETSAKIAGYDDTTKDPKTTWCTARTKGSNLFYHYISRGDILAFLFYIIRDNPAETEDWLSMGWVGNLSEGLSSIKPVYSIDGGMTVDRDNKGLSEGDFRRILGSDFETIFRIMKDKMVELEGKNPATKELEPYASNFSLFKKDLWSKSTEERRDFANIILEMNPTDEVRGLATLTAYPESIISREYSSKPWAKPYLDLAAKRVAEKNPQYILQYKGEPWAKPYLDLAAKRVIEEEPQYILQYSGDPWAEEYLPLAAKRVIEKDPRYILQYHREPWAEKYLPLAAKIVAEKEPQWILRYNGEPWAKPYLPLAAKRVAEKEPQYILRYHKKPWAEEYFPLAAKRVAEEEPDIILYYPWEPWAKPYLPLAAKRVMEKDPIKFLIEFIQYAKEKWAAPSLNEAINLVIKEDPESFLRNYSEQYWATEKRDSLNGKSYNDLAIKFLKTEEENEEYDKYVTTERMKKRSNFTEMKLNILKSTLNKIGINISFDLIKL